MKKIKYVPFSLITVLTLNFGLFFCFPIFPENTPASPEQGEEVYVPEPQKELEKTKETSENDVEYKTYPPNKSNSKNEEDKPTVVQEHKVEEKIIEQTEHKTDSKTMESSHKSEGKAKNVEHKASPKIIKSLHKSGEKPKASEHKLDSKAVKSEPKTEAKPIASEHNNEKKEAEPEHKSEENPVATDNKNTEKFMELEHKNESEKEPSVKHGGEEEITSDKAKTPEAQDMKIEANKLVESDDKVVEPKKYSGIFWFIGVFLTLLMVIFGLT